MDNELRNGKREMDEMHKDRPFIQERVPDSPQFLSSALLDGLNELASKWRKLSKKKSSNEINAGFNLACSIHADALDHIIEQNAPAHHRP